MLGRILFAWFRGTDLDNNSKMWRLSADLFNDAAFFLEILSPSLPDSFFLPIVCSGSVLKSIVSVAGGATRSSLNEHQATRNNMADVAAKDGSQEMAVGLISMILGFYLTPLIDTDLKTWLFFVAFTCLHLFANYRAVRCIVLSKLNRQRSGILIRHWFESYEGKTQKGEILSPAQVAREEFTFYFEERRPYKVRLGVPLVRVLPENAKEMLAFVKKFKEEKNKYILKQTSREILVALQADATSIDVLKAYFHAQLYQISDSTKEQLDTPKMNLLKDLIRDPTSLQSAFNTFLTSLENKNWQVASNLLGTTEWRFNILN
eukprot:TRINITY_DN2138_c0_g1_i1.p1 TRINITY_DN2138_c0_g1~~TRINITY_DN2138_c0_g1_i1.p1  ORF type:complete len:319 (-),score=59.26 TRINITY_DN2138_c0_g1_i1:15-971(-)